jgi:hypothetical protein
MNTSSTLTELLDGLIPWHAFRKMGWLPERLEDRLKAHGVFGDSDCGDWL